MEGCLATQSKKTSQTLLQSFIKTKRLQNSFVDLKICSSNPNSFTLNKIATNIRFANTQTLKNV